MKTFTYMGKTYWHCTPIAAIRPNKDRLEIVNFEADGTITLKSRTVRPDQLQVVEDIFKQGALA